MHQTDATQVKWFCKYHWKHHLGNKVFTMGETTFISSRAQFMKCWLDVCLWEGKREEDNNIRRVKDKYLSILWPSFKRGQRGLLLWHLLHNKFSSLCWIAKSSALKWRPTKNSSLTFNSLKTWILFIWAIVQNIQGKASSSYEATLSCYNLRSLP